MKVTITAEELQQWRVESQEPDGLLVDSTVSGIGICEGRGCYSGQPNVHAHATETWGNGAKRETPLPVPRHMASQFLIRLDRNIYLDWLTNSDGSWLE
jgi:hypothetical protein